jgi:hypothetical protein
VRHDQPRCLNVGCGLSTGPSWVSVDCSASLRLSRLPFVGRVLAKVAGLPNWPPSVVYGDIVKGHVVPPGSCDLVFASHVLEHLTEEDCCRALTHIYGYLRPGGYFRCIVPDLETYARRYLAGLASGDRLVAGQASRAFMTQTGLGREQSRGSMVGRMRDAVSNARHQWMWDRYALSAALTRVGFQNVEVRAFGEWADDRFREVEEKARHEDSVCLEGQRPRAETHGLG